MIRIAVIDGQGASIGSAIIRKIRQTYGETLEIWALGTNAIATGQMLKAGQTVEERERGPFVTARAGQMSS